MVKASHVKADREKVHIADTSTSTLLGDTSTSTLLRKKCVLCSYLPSQ